MKVLTSDFKLIFIMTVPVKFASSLVKTGVTDRQSQRNIPWAA